MPPKYTKQGAHQITCRLINSVPTLGTNIGVEFGVEFDANSASMSILNSAPMMTGTRSHDYV